MVRDLAQKALTVTVVEAEVKVVEVTVKVVEDEGKVEAKNGNDISREMTMTITFEESCKT